VTHARPPLVAAAVPVLLGAPCGPPIQILSPDKLVDTFNFVVQFRVNQPIEPGSLRVEINRVSILDRVTGGPQDFTAVIAPGAPLRDDNLLQIRANRADHGKYVATQSFKYLPPGKARAHRIEDPDDLSTNRAGDRRVVSCPA
jgi:hypothetical protein